MIEKKTLKTLHKSLIELEGSFKNLNTALSASEKRKENVSKQLNMVTKQLNTLSQPTMVK